MFCVLQKHNLLNLLWQQTKAYHRIEMINLIFAQAEEMWIWSYSTLLIKFIWFVWTDRNVQSTWPKPNALCFVSLTFLCDYCTLCLQRNQMMLSFFCRVTELRTAHRNPNRIKYLLKSSPATQTTTLLTFSQTE